MMMMNGSRLLFTAQQILPESNGRRCLHSPGRHRVVTSASKKQYIIEKAVSNCYFLTDTTRSTITTSKSNILHRLPILDQQAPPPHHRSPQPSPTKSHPATPGRPRPPSVQSPPHTTTPAPLPSKCSGSSTTNPQPLRQPSPPTLYYPSPP
jgi:hypothetical protein